MKQTKTKITKLTFKNPPCQFHILPILLKGFVSVVKDNNKGVFIKTYKSTVGEAVMEIIRENKDVV